MSGSLSPLECGFNVVMLPLSLDRSGGWTGVLSVDVVLGPSCDDIGCGRVLVRLLPPRVFELASSSAVAMSGLVGGDIGC